MKSKTTKKTFQLFFNFIVKIGNLKIFHLKSFLKKSFVSLNHVKLQAMCQKQPCDLQFVKNKTVYSFHKFLET